MSINKRKRTVTWHNETKNANTNHRYTSTDNGDRIWDKQDNCWCDEYGIELLEYDDDEWPVKVNIISVRNSDKSKGGNFLIPRDQNKKVGEDIDYEPLTQNHQSKIALDYNNLPPEIQLTTNSSLQELQKCVALQLQDKHEGSGLNQLTGGRTSRPDLYIRMMTSGELKDRKTTEATPNQLKDVFGALVRLADDGDDFVTINVVVVREDSSDDDEEEEEEDEEEEEEEELLAAPAQIKHCIAFQVQEETVRQTKKLNFVSPSNTYSKFNTVKIDVTESLVQLTTTSHTKKKLPNKLDETKLKTQFWGDNGNGMRKQLVDAAMLHNSDITADSRVFSFSTATGIAATALNDDDLCKIVSSKKIHHVEVFKTNQSRPALITEIVIPIRVGFSAGTVGATEALKEGGETATPQREKTSTPGIHSNANFVTLTAARSKEPEIKAKFMECFLDENFVWFRGFTLLQMKLVIEWKISKNTKYTELFLADPCSGATTALLSDIRWDALNIVNGQCGEPQKNLYPTAMVPPLGETQEEETPTVQPSEEHSIASSMIAVQQQRSEVAVTVAEIHAASEEKIAVLHLMAAGGAAAVTLKNQVDRRQTIVKALKRYILQVKKHVLVKTNVGTEDVWQLRQPCPTNSDPQIMSNEKVLGKIGIEFEENFNEMGKHLVALGEFVQRLGWGTSVNDPTNEDWLQFEIYAQEEETALLTIQTWITDCNKEEFDPSTKISPGSQFTLGMLVDMWEYA